MFKVKTKHVLHLSELSWHEQKRVSLWLAKNNARLFRLKFASPWSTHVGFELLVLTNCHIVLMETEVLLQWNTWAIVYQKWIHIVLHTKPWCSFYILQTKAMLLLRYAQNRKPNKCEHIYTKKNRILSEQYGFIVQPVYAAHVWP